MASRESRRAAKRSRVQKVPTPRDAVALAQEMEEPLRHAINLTRVIAQAYRPDDEDMDALAFVATAARLKLEEVNDLLQDAIKKARFSRP
jgi:hypothetical protein